MYNISSSHHTITFANLRCFVLPLPLMPFFCQSTFPKAEINFFCKLALPLFFPKNQQKMKMCGIKINYFAPEKKT